MHLNALFVLYSLSNIIPALFAYWITFREARGALKHRLRRAWIVAQPMLIPFYGIWFLWEFLTFHFKQTFTQWYSFCIYPSHHYRPIEARKDPLYRLSDVRPSARQRYLRRCLYVRSECLLREALVK